MKAALFAIGLAACSARTAADTIEPPVAKAARAETPAAEPVQSQPWYSRGDSACREGANLTVQSRGDETLHTCEKGGRLSGPFTLAAASGNRVQQGWLAGGALDRSVVTWDDNGAQIDRVSYRAGVVHGPHAVFYPNGVLASRGSFGNGLPHGEYTSWYDSGAQRERGSFASGKPQGRWTYWDEAGNVTRIEVFRRGELYERRGVATAGELYRGAYVTRSNLARIFVGHEIVEGAQVDDGVSRRVYELTLGGKRVATIREPPPSVFR